MPREAVFRMRVKFFEAEECCTDMMDEDGSESRM